MLRPFGFIATKHSQVIWLSKFSILSVPDEGYSRNVPDEGYSRNASCALNLISTFLLLVWGVLWEARVYTI